MFNLLKRNKKLHEDNKRLMILHDELVNKIVILEEKIKNPKAEDVIKNLLGRGIEWYDYSQMDMAGQYQYYQGAKSLLENEIFKNEYNHYIADQVKFCGYETKNHEQTMNVRSGIMALESFVDRIKEIPNPQDRDKDINIEEQSKAI